MSCNISTLEPQNVWKHFYEICTIPHPSGHEEAIREYIINIAKSNNLEYIVDKANNIIVRKNATLGMESRRAIALQSHLDMVPQKNSEKVFDFEKDAIQPIIEGEWVTADGTTLGSDNGIGVAAILAILASNELEHGAIEALFTATEETGMHGAFGLEKGGLKAEILLNLDSETEGELYVGCAGGLDANITFESKETKIEGDYKSFEISVKGLKGGHSGVDIILKRANANKVLFRALKIASEKCNIEISSLNGGDLRNAIPRESRALIVVPAKSESKLVAQIKEFEGEMQSEYGGIEDNLSIEMRCIEPLESIISPEVKDSLIKAICEVPNDVISMSESMIGLVQTSSNLAIVSSRATTIHIECLLRSSSNSEKDDLAKSIASVFDSAGANVEFSGGYSGWNPNMDSPILKAMGDIYENLYGKRAKITAIHAGLECGIIGGTYPDMDMISFGPTICFPHSPDEKVNIQSVSKFWEFLCNTLSNAPKK